MKSMLRAPVDRLGLLLDVEGVDAERALAELLVGAGVLGEHQDAVAGVDGRRLLGDEVHAVEERVDHEQVEVLVAGDGLVEVLVDAEVDRHPVGRAVAVVDDRDERLDPLQVLLVLGDVLPRRLQVGDERDPLVELRVVGEELVEGGEAAEDVLGEVGAVDADDQVLAAAGEQLALVVGDLLGRGDAAQALGVDPERVGADPDLAVAVADDLVAVVDLAADQLAAAVEEVVDVGGGVEADDVVAEQAVEDLVAPLARQDPPGVRVRPGDVDEVVEERLGPLARGRSPAPCRGGSRGTSPAAAPARRAASAPSGRCRR